jgi:hypothetical protein
MPAKKPIKESAGQPTKKLATPKAPVKRAKGAR